jgi:hypothetical protein
MVKIRSLALLIVGLGFTSTALPQKRELPNLGQPGAIIPDSVSRRIDQLASYIERNFTGKKEKLAAIYTWVSTNLTYDVVASNSLNYYADKKEIIAEALKKKKGICIHYSMLFDTIARKVGFESYVVYGRSKQFEKIDNKAHAWCAFKIDSTWWLCDPTWGAGSITYSNQFVSKFNGQYFAQTPQDFIKEHFPFDPIWQLLSRPVTFNQFARSTTTGEGNFLNFNDSIRRYRSLGEKERIISSIERIQKTDETDEIKSDRIEQMKVELENIVGNNFAIQFNSAIQTYNQSLIYLNEFIQCRNNKINDYDKLKSLLFKSENALTISRNIARKLEAVDQESLNRLNQFNKSLINLEQNLGRQKGYTKTLKN